MNDRFERFSAIVAEISYNLHKIAMQATEKYGLKGPYAIYLLTLYRYEEGVTAAKLCELCHRDKSDVSRAVAMMVKSGLLERESDTPYRSRLRLTELGRESAQELRTIVEKAVAVIDLDVDEDERETMYAALGKISSSLRLIGDGRISLE